MRPERAESAQAAERLCASQNLRSTEVRSSLGWVAPFQALGGDFQRRNYAAQAERDYAVPMASL